MTAWETNNVALLVHKNRPNMLVGIGCIDGLQTDLT